MKRLFDVFLPLLSVAIFIGIFGGCVYAAAPGQPSTSLLKQLSKQTAYLTKNQHHYADCARTELIAPRMMQQTAASFAAQGIAESSIQPLQSQFLQSYTADCNRLAIAYEATYKTYQATRYQLAASSQSYFDRLMRREVLVVKQPSVIAASFQLYEPASLQSSQNTAARPLFTEQQLVSFLTTQLT